MDGDGGQAMYGGVQLATQIGAGVIRCVCAVLGGGPNEARQSERGRACVAGCLLYRYCALVSYVSASRGT